MERRTHPRYVVSCPADFNIEVLGSEFLVEHFNATGLVVDISRKGLLAEVDRLVGVGTDCEISLFDAGAVVRRRALRGTVRRSCIGSAGWRIAVQFAELVELQPPSEEPRGIDAAAAHPT